ncbi:hypothetical protein LAZ29_01060, partial [Cereibacter sphaeroides]|nr:hypothetical protein [Cereibacter sphaeroides]
ELSGVTAFSIGIDEFYSRFPAVLGVLKLKLVPKIEKLLARNIVHLVKRYFSRSIGECGASN